jgi:nucleoside diphosphate kinase
MKKCPKCSTEHEKSGKYCSYKCSNSRAWNDLDKLTKSIAAKKSDKLKEVNKISGLKLVEYGKQFPKEKIRIDWICPVCESVLKLPKHISKNRKYCSGTCRNKVNNQIIRGTRSKAEKHLELSLTEKFPNLEIVYNSRKILSNNKELDVYIPSLKLAIEWNGPWHYMDCRTKEFLNGIKERDLQKEEECKVLGIKLYVVKDLVAHKKFIHSEVDKIINLINTHL